MQKIAKYSSVTVMLCSILISATFAADTASENPVPQLNAAATSTFIAQRDSAQILDVRTPKEYEMSHIPGALNINVQDESFDSLVEKLDRSKTYIVHCTKNPWEGRSSRALETLQSLGFKRLYSLEGGYLAWKEAGLPLKETE